MTAKDEHASVLNPYADGSKGTEGSFTIPKFRFESGATMADMTVGYVTHGELNSRRDNMVLVTPGTANTRHSFDGYIGPSEALDPEQYFIVAVDAIGAGTSSKPADGLGGRFPHYTVRDMVRAQHEFLTHAFNLSATRLRAVVGASMGAFQALEWGIHFPDSVEDLVLLVPASRASNVFKTVVGQMVRIIELDQNWEEGAGRRPLSRGLETAGRHYLPWTVTDAYLDRLSATQLEEELAASARRFAGWDAWSLIRRYQASSGHDVSQPFQGHMNEALRQVKAAALVMPSRTDRLLPPQLAREIAEHVPGSRYTEIPSDCGHFGWRPIEGSVEKAFITQEIKTFLQRAGRTG